MPLRKVVGGGINLSERLLQRGGHDCRVRVHEGRHGKWPCRTGEAIGGDRVSTCVEVEERLLLREGAKLAQISTATPPLTRERPGISEETHASTDDNDGLLKDLLSALCGYALGQSPMKISSKHPHINMFALLAPAMLLLGAVTAQTNTPSVVTFISISPVPTTEGVFTIQTSVPGSPAFTSACYENCIMEPCTPCAQPNTNNKHVRTLLIANRRSHLRDLRRINGHPTGRDSYPELAVKLASVQRYHWFHHAHRVFWSNTGVVLGNTACPAIDCGRVISTTAGRTHSSDFRFGCVRAGTCWRLLHSSVRREH